MSYFRRIFGLGVVLVAIFMVAFVSLAAAHETTQATLGDEMVANVGMLQTTPAATDTVTTDQVTDTTVATATTTPAGTDNTGGAAQETVTATTEAAGGAAQTTATPVGGTQQQPGNLPATGGEIGLPWTTLALIIVGGLILFSGLGLALSRRS